MFSNFSLVFFENSYFCLLPKIPNGNFAMHGWVGGSWKNTRHSSNVHRLRCGLKGYRHPLTGKTNHLILDSWKIFSELQSLHSFCILRVSRKQLERQQKQKTNNNLVPVIEPNMNFYQKSMLSTLFWLIK